MEKGVKKQPACTWIEVNGEVHVFVVDDQEHPQMLEIHTGQRDSLCRCMMLGMCQIRNLFCMMWRKKRSCFNCVTIVRNWPLDLGSSTHLLVLHAALQKTCGYAVTATLPSSSYQR
jgi:hypothetical protein